MFTSTVVINSLKLKKTTTEHRNLLVAWLLLHPGLSLLILCSCLRCEYRPTDYSRRKMRWVFMALSKCQKWQRKSPSLAGRYLPLLPSAVLLALPWRHCVTTNDHRSLAARPANRRAAFGLVVTLDWPRHGVNQACNPSVLGDVGRIAKWAQGAGVTREVYGWRPRWHLSTGQNGEIWTSESDGDLSTLIMTRVHKAIYRVRRVTHPAQTSCGRPVVLYCMRGGRGCTLYWDRRQLVSPVVMRRGFALHAVYILLPVTVTSESYLMDAGTEVKLILPECK